MKSFLTLTAALAGFVLSLPATEARIESMGKDQHFFLDDMSIFYNPANVGTLGGFLTGSLGRVQPNTDDPLRPWFGGVLLTPITKDLKVFYGGAFNRFDPVLDRISLIRNFDISGTFSRTANANNVQTLDTVITNTHSVLLPTLRGRIEGILGVSYKEMLSAGFHFYQAGEDSSFLESVIYGDKMLLSMSGDPNLRWKSATRSLSLENHLKKFDGGVTLKQKSYTVEAYGGMARYSLGGTYESVDSSYTFNNALNQSTDTVVTGTYSASLQTYNSVMGGARAFFSVPFLALDAVPSVYFEKLKFNKFNQTNFSGGAGIIKAIDRGLFWGGVELFQDQMQFVGDSTFTNQGLHISFGLEKGMGWDWFLVRVGGSRRWYSQKVEGENGAFVRNSWEENTDVDGTPEDLIGFGIGLNFEGRLKFDITLNEALPYFNLFGQGLMQSPNGAHPILQISSTFNL